MRYHGGAARSCSSFADLIKKIYPAISAKLALNRWILFFGQIGKTRAATGRAAMIACSYLIISYAYNYPPVPPRDIAVAHAKYLLYLR